MDVRIIAPSAAQQQDKTKILFVNLCTNTSGSPHPPLQVVDKLQ